MKRCLVIAGLFLGLACGLRAQVMDTTVCDVVKKPASFDGKTVRIKGTVVAGFDEFVIKDAADPNCGFPVNAIWLSYPQGTKGKAGPAAMVTVQPAHNFTGKYAPPTRTPVTLDKSKDFKQFDSLLSQTHEKGAGMCLGCTRYEVTATLVGRLDTVASAGLTYDAGGKIIGFGGFGNMNAYPARLVLQAVSDVTPKEVDFSRADDASKGSSSQQASGGSGADMGRAVQMVQKLAAAMAASPVKDSAVKAAAVFGQNTGVVAGSGITNEAQAKDEMPATQDSPDGALFTCTFNTERMQGNALMQGLMHLGDHIVEMRSPDASNMEAAAYMHEANALVVTVVAVITTGEKFLTLPGGHMVWNFNWPAADRDGKMQSAMNDYLDQEMMLSR
jgi:hypothetical protein